ncbi:MAG: hypothetical protein ABI175_26755, partial [Polyangiales bacterium]
EGDRDDRPGVRRVKLAASVAIVVVLGRMSIASACDPAPRYGVTVDTDDTPDCLVVENLGSDDQASLGFRNECKDSVHVSVVACAACGAELDVAPGARGIVAIETRKLGAGITQDVPTKQSLAWSTNGAKGLVTTTVTWRDTWAACRGKKGSGSKSSRCAIGNGAAPGNPFDVWFLATAALLVLWRRRVTSAPFRSAHRESVTTRSSSGRSRSPVR